MVNQCTLARAVSLSGIGVHSGRATMITVQPAEPNTGIVFRRIDLSPSIQIPAKSEFVGDTRLNTCLYKDGVSVSTIEHLMSAFFGLGIDNAVIDVSSEELPIMDGSSAHFVKLIQEAGIQSQTQSKQFIRIKRSVKIAENDKYVSFEPYEGCRFSLTIDFSHPVIRQSQQTLALDLNPTDYIETISRARTFGFLSEYEWLKKNNLGLGASLENTVALDDSKVLNEGGLHYPDEFVKHKTLDAIGDMYLLGHPFIGAFSGHKSGHDLNHRLRQALLADNSAWELVVRA